MLAEYAVSQAAEETARLHGAQGTAAEERGTYEGEAAADGNDKVETLKRPDQSEAVVVQELQDDVNLQEAKGDHSEHAVPKVLSSSERSNHLGKVFLAFDLNGSGAVDSNELMVLGKTRHELQQKDRDWSKEKNSNLVETIDVDANGHVSLEEFVRHFAGEFQNLDDLSFMKAVLDYMACAANVAKDVKQGPVSSVLKRSAMRQLLVTVSRMQKDEIRMRVGLWRQTVWHVSQVVARLVMGEVRFRTELMKQVVWRTAMTEEMLLERRHQEEMDFVHHRMDMAMQDAALHILKGVIARTFRFDLSCRLHVWIRKAEACIWKENSP